MNMLNANQRQEPEKTDSHLLLRILEEVEADSKISQRKLSANVGIALGMVNTYVQRCVRKGWIKTQQVPAKRYSYYLTPQGMSEKTRLVHKYMQSSFSLFRQVRIECEELFTCFEKEHVNKVTIVGAGDVQDIAYLVAKGYGFTTEKIHAVADIKNPEGIVLTDIEKPQETYNLLCDNFGMDKVYSLPLLKVHNKESL